MQLMLVFLKYYLAATEARPTQKRKKLKADS